MKFCKENRSLNFVLVSQENNRRGAEVPCHLSVLTTLVGSVTLLLLTRRRTLSTAQAEVVEKQGLRPDPSPAPLLAQVCSERW